MVAPEAEAAALKRIQDPNVAEAGNHDGAFRTTALAEPVSVEYGIKDDNVIESSDMVGVVVPVATSTWSEAPVTLVTVPPEPVEVKLTVEPEVEQLIPVEQLSTP